MDGQTKRISTCRLDPCKGSSKKGCVHFLLKRAARQAPGHVFGKAGDAHLLLPQPGRILLSYSCSTTSPTTLSMVLLWWLRGLEPLQQLWKVQEHQGCDCNVEDGLISLRSLLLWQKLFMDGNCSWPLVTWRLSYSKPYGISLVVGITCSIVQCSYDIHQDIVTEQCSLGAP